MCANLSIKKTKYLYPLAVAIYVVIHIILILHHEAWGDEAQAWNIAKNTTFWGVFPALCAEGHPAGWFLLIKLFQFFGGSFYQFSFLSLLLMAVSFTLLLYRAPFPLYLKCIIGLGSVFIYFNPVICRTYSFVVIVVTLIAVFWPYRYQKPILFGFLVFLLFQTHILMAGMACSLCVILIAESIKSKKGRTNYKKACIGSCFAVSGMLLTFVELYPRSTVEKSVDYTSASILSTIDFSRILFIPKNLFATVPLIFFSVLLLLLLPLTIYAIRSWHSYGDILIIAICSVGFIIAVNLSIYSITIHSATLIPLIALFVYWISYGSSTDQYVKVLSVVFICILSIGTYRTWFRSARSDFLRDFSENKKMADYINENLEENSIIIIKDEELTRAGVYAYVNSVRPDIIFWCPDTGSDYSFFNWSVKVSPITNSEAAAEARNKYPNSNIYFISWKEENDDFLVSVFVANDFCEKNDPSWLYQIS